MTTRIIGSLIEVDDSSITVSGPEAPLPPDATVRAVRLYSNAPALGRRQEAATWTLQVRGPETLETIIRPGRPTRKIEGENYIVASATLDLRQLYELSDAVQTLIAEAEGWA